MQRFIYSDELNKLAGKTGRLRKQHSDMLISSAIHQISLKAFRGKRPEHQKKGKIPAQGIL
jgi:hypothetical protein